MRRVLLAVALSLFAICVKAQGTGSGAGTGAGAATVSVTSGDTTPPSFSSGPSSSVTSSSVTITATTNEATNYQICKRLTSGGANVCNTLQASFSTAHSDTFSGLSSSTQYWYVVIVIDVAGNSTTSSEGNFTTSASGGGGTYEPDCGLLDNSTVIVPTTYWSTTQNRPATDPTITSITRSGGASVTATVNSATGLVVGSYITVQGVSQADMNIANQTGLTGSCSGTTCTVTTSSDHHLATGMVITIESASSGAWEGSWTVASTPTTTTFTFTHGVSGIASMTSGTLVTGVQITGISGNDVSWTHAGATGTSSGGTIAGRKWQKPISGGSYTDPEFGCTVTKLGQTSLGPGLTQNNLFYSTGNWTDKDGNYLLSRTDSGWNVWNTSTGAWIQRTTATGNPINWSTKTAGIGYYTPFSSNTLRKYTESTNTTSLQKTFSQCSKAEMGGPGSGVEGYVVAGSTGNDVLPIICDDSTTGQIHVFAYDVDADSILTDIDLGANVTDSSQLDHAKLFPVLGGNNKIFIRFGSGSPNSGNGLLGTGQISSISCSGGTFTVNTVIDFPNAIGVGEKVRIQRASPAGFNGLWTVATVPTTKQFTITSGAACPAASATIGTATAIGSQRTGMTVWNSAGTFNNNVEAIGAHNDIGVDAESELVVAMHKNSSNGPATFASCNNTANVGVVMIKADATTNWAQGSACDDEVQTYLAYMGANIYSGGGGFSSFNTNISIQNGWAAINLATNSSAEASLGATWDSATSWGKWFNEVVMFELSDAAGRKSYRVARLYTRTSNYDQQPKCWLRRDGQAIYCNMDFADNNSQAVTDQMKIRVIVP